MGQPQARLGDMTSQHPSPTHSAIQLSSGSQTVFINGMPQITDSVIQAIPHPPIPPNPPEPPFQVQMGSQTVFINGMGAARLGDVTTCGSVIIEGSQDVLIG